MTKIEVFRFHNGYTIPPYYFILHITEITHKRKKTSQELKPNYNIKYGYECVHQLVEGSWIGC